MRIQAAAGAVASAVCITAIAATTHAQPRSVVGATTPTAAGQPLAPPALVPATPGPPQPPPAPVTTSPTKSPMAWAGEQQLLGLPELLASAVETNPALMAAKFDIEIARAQMDLADSRTDWIFDASLNVQSNRAFFANMTGRQTRVTLNGTATRALTSGGAVTITAQTAATDSAFDSFDARQWADSITASISHPLLAGKGSKFFGIANRRVEVDQKRIAIAQRESAINAVQAVVSAYWDLALAQSELAIAQSSLALANERLRVTKLAIAGGRAAPNDDLAVLQAIATRQEEVLAGELTVVTRAIALRRAAGLPIEAKQLGLRVDVALRPTNYDGSNVSAVIERAFAQSPELARLQAAGEAATIDVEVAENGLLPQLNAVLTLGPTGTGEKAIDALTGLVTNPGIVVAGSLTFQRALNQKEAHARKKLATATLQRTTVNARDVKAQLATSATIALGQIELAAARVELAERTIALADRNIENEIARFSLGKATNFDVLQRQEEKKAAELRRVRAIVDGNRSATTVMAITGEILSHYGISAPRSTGG